VVKKLTDRVGEYKMAKNILNGKANGPDKNNVLFVGAHPDDIELGCLGTIMNYAEKGKNITCLIASDGERGISRDSEQIRREESMLALMGAGVKKENIIFLNMPDTKLNDHYNAILEQVESTCKDRNIGRVFFHTMKDRHQDHRAIHDITLGAARFVSDVLTFESNSSTLPAFCPNYYVDIGEYIKKKVDLLAHHQSQMDKQYMEVSSVTAQARNRGEHSKKFAYAEAFEVVRLNEV
jgi:LmbE family N-acetylglucosaminyl deacetylase